ncbi:MAG: hypothetical protein FWE27_03180 [Defluviitaleaceae bacterium]|nr:hypothetical protein [Defluviitaleaceae bacterium]
MNESIKNTPGFIVSNAILYRESTFTLEDILNSVMDKLLHEYFETIEKLKSYIKEKLVSLCKSGLVSNTELFYYVN